MNYDRRLRLYNKLAKDRIPDASIEIRFVYSILSPDGPSYGQTRWTDGCIIIELVPREIGQHDDEVEIFAHELAHIVLKHNEVSAVMRGIDDKLVEMIQEVEAEALARELIDNWHESGKLNGVDFDA